MRSVVLHCLVKAIVWSVSAGVQYIDDGAVRGSSGRRDAEVGVDSGGEPRMEMLEIAPNRRARFHSRRPASTYVKKMEKIHAKVVKKKKNGKQKVVTMHSYMMNFFPMKANEQAARINVGTTR